MELFQQLGAEIEETWREQNYNEDLFPSIAADALRRANLPSKLSAWEIVEWTLDQEELPRQKDPNANFGDPPITVYVGPRFFIDAYFWLNGTTEVHQHAFCGAFQVLLGSSLHSWYDFQPTEKVNVFTQIGTMELKACHLLNVGDVQEILAGRQYIHSLFHLDRPSVTIVIRTDKSPLHQPQFSYHKPSIALDPFFVHETTTKHLQTIRALYETPHPDADKLVGRMLERTDFQTSFVVLWTARDFLGDAPLDQLFNLANPGDRFRELLAIVQRRHGSKAEKLAAVFDHRDRVSEIVRRRSYLTNSEHRFFLALLLNVEGRHHITSLIKQRFPDADPIEKTLDWVHELSQTRVVGVNTPNGLGIEGFGDVDLSLLEHLMRGKPESEAREAVVAEYGAERSEAANLEEKLSRIRSSYTLRPLLSE